MKKIIVIGATVLVAITVFLAVYKSAFPDTELKDSSPVPQAEKLITEDKKDVKATAPTKTSAVNAVFDEYKTILDSKLSGSGLIAGVYYEYAGDWWKEEYGDELSKCTAFEVHSGDATLLKKYFDDIVIGKNTIQHINKNGFLIVNLPFRRISEENKKIIEGSNSDSQVTLKVSEGQPKYGDAAPCHSFFETVEIAN